MPEDNVEELPAGDAGAGAQKPPSPLLPIVAILVLLPVLSFLMTEFVLIPRMKAAVAEQTCLKIRGDAKDLADAIGVAASIYLEEFAPQNRFTDFIEVNISNLAAVPSIVFGILGLAIFINFAGLPQSAPIVGGLVLTLMTLPTIIIATRASLKAVPPSIRDAALGVGASKMQSVFHHVLPLAAPGILTGTIIGLAQALGETAPLLLIGMVAFVREYPDAPPDGFFDPASALPVQVYNWTQRADPAFVERASGAIIVLLIFLVLMNTLAVILRRRFERRW